MQTCSEDLTMQHALQVAAANVLMIGAGGIGCELIKTLVMTGFRNVTMVRGSALSAAFTCCDPKGSIKTRPHTELCTQDPLIFSL